MLNGSEQYNNRMFFQDIDFIITVYFCTHKYIYYVHIVYKVIFYIYVCILYMYMRIARSNGRIYNFAINAVRVGVRRFPDPDVSPRHTGRIKMRSVN